MNDDDVGLKVQLDPITAFVQLESLGRAGDYSHSVIRISALLVKQSAS